MTQIRNQVNLIGFVGRDPDYKLFENGSKLARFSMATSERYKNQQDEWVEKTQWHNIIAWGKLADVASQHLEKGSEAAITGKIQYRVFDGSDGQKKYYTEILADQILVVNKKNASGESADLVAEPETSGKTAKAK